MSSERELIAGMQYMEQATGRWLVVIARGGHFAAALFDMRATKKGKHANDEQFQVVAHRTFHR